MAVFADDGLMRAGQLKSREIVIERCRLPRLSRMASRAILWKSGLHVRWLLRALKIILMATKASRRGAFELAGVAVNTLRSSVSQSKRERRSMGERR